MRSASFQVYDKLVLNTSSLFQVTETKSAGYEFGITQKLQIMPHFEMKNVDTRKIGQYQRL